MTLGKGVRRRDSLGHCTCSGAYSQHPGKTGRSRHRVKILTKVSSPRFLSVVPGPERKVQFHVALPVQIQIGR